MRFAILALLAGSAMGMPHADSATSANLGAANLGASTDGPTDEHDAKIEKVLAEHGHDEHIIAALLSMYDLGKGVTLASAQCGTASADETLAQCLARNDCKETQETQDHCLGIAQCLRDTCLRTGDLAVARGKCGGEYFPQMLECVKLPKAPVTPPPESETTAPVTAAVTAPVTAPVTASCTTDKWGTCEQLKNNGPWRAGFCDKSFYKNVVCCGTCAS